MGHVLLIYLLALTFSVIAPLLLPFSVIWFVFAWVQWRHNLCYVYQRKYESGGLMWTYMFSRICICLVTMQLFTFCVLAFKGAYVQAFLIVAFMPALTIKFHRSCHRRFGRGVENVPLELASRAPRGRVPPLVYIPPPLQEKSWGWYPVRWGAAAKMMVIHVAWRLYGSVEAFQAWMCATHIHCVPPRWLC
jgi:hypothetical protein